MSTSTALAPPAGRPPCAARTHVDAAPRPTCASCTHLGLTCRPRCRTAPYFPADRLERFLYACRLFGLKTIVRSLRAEADGRMGECRWFWNKSNKTPSMAAIVLLSDAAVAEPERVIRKFELHRQRRLQCKANRLQKQSQQPRQQPAMLPDPYAVVAMETVYDSTSDMDADAGLATCLQMLCLSSAA
uniref:LOB domain-containing protein n=1 Tax=Leersia perrieri TaxID=77586 RepID=A0A0D9V263_9ORYZ